MLDKSENNVCFYSLDGISFYNDNRLELASNFSKKHNALNDKFETILGDNVIKNGEKLYFEGEMNFKIDDMCFRTINGFTWRDTFNWKLYWNPFDCSGDSPIRCGYQDEDNYVTIYYTIPDELWGGVCFGTPENMKKIRIKYEDGTYVQCDDVIIQDYNYVINWGEEVGWTD